MGHTSHLVVSSAFRGGREITSLHCAEQGGFSPLQRTKAVMQNTEERNKTPYPYPVSPDVAEYESFRHAHTFPRYRKGIV